MRSTLCRLKLRSEIPSSIFRKNIEFKLNDRVSLTIGNQIYTGEISRVKHAGEHRGVRIEIESTPLDNGMTMVEVFIPPSKLHLVKLI